MTMYEPPIAYHTFLTQFTQIHLKKGERIKDFNSQIFNTLNKILEEKKPNAPIIFGCYKNEMPSNVNFSIRSSRINNLNASIQKEMKMEEFMVEKNVDPDIILGKVQREVNTLAISNQGMSTSRNVENQGVGGGIL